MLKSRDTLWLLGQAVAISLISAALFVQLTPATELTRFRNSLIATMGTTADFDWTPSTIPEDFRKESSADNSLLDIDEDFNHNDSLSLMKEFVVHLRDKPKRQGPIKASTAIAYRRIRDTGQGYCADYTQVFNALAHVTRMPVREWGMSFDRFGGDGHAFSEVYSEELGQWIFVDPMNAFFVVDETLERPLSVLEFHSRLSDPALIGTISVTPIADKFLFKNGESALRYYRNGADQFFLWFGNDVLSYDQHPLVRIVGPISRPLEQLLAIISGIHPRIRILPTDSNGREIEELAAFRDQIIVLLVVGLSLGISIAWRFHRARRARRE